ncbi:MAG: hypothetical protein AAF434_17300 [Pseudomonadota bacterium]
MTNNKKDVLQSPLLKKSHAHQSGRDYDRNQNSVVISDELAAEIKHRADCMEAMKVLHGD